MLESKIGNTAILAMLSSVIGVAGSLFGWQLEGTDVSTISTALTGVASGLLWYFRRYKPTTTVDRTV